MEKKIRKKLILKKRQFPNYQRKFKNSLLEQQQRQYVQIVHLMLVLQLAKISKINLHLSVRNFSLINANLEVMR
jgi:hypothetical protein